MLLLAQRGGGVTVSDEVIWRCAAPACTRVAKELEWVGRTMGVRRSKCKEAMGFGKLAGITFCCIRSSMFRQVEACCVRCWLNLGTLRSYVVVLFSSVFGVVHVMVNFYSAEETH